jgi:hypothetical protein
MGITIAFEGKLASPEAFERLAASVASAAAGRGWAVRVADEAEATLTRYFEDEEFEITGPVKALLVTAHDDCDPIRLEFDKNWLVQDFVKTQFAGSATHREVVGFFREIQPHFAELNVDDEAEYWDTDDDALLEQHFAAFDDALAQSLRKHPGAKVKVKTPDGRIMDLVVEHENLPSKRWWQFWRGAG